MTNPTDEAASQTGERRGQDRPPHEQPPRAPCAFRVGVVGHRPDRLQRARLEDLGELVETLLKKVKEEVLRVYGDHRQLYDEDRPVLRALSPLAEGADRLFAHRALASKYELCCVLPFHEKDFEEDFESPKALEKDSKERFASLLKRATTRFELDGCRKREAAAYEYCGSVVLNQSDLLFVIWDGRREEKRGGTEGMFDEAGQRGIPIVWIDAWAPHRWQLLEAGANLPDPETKTRAVPSGEGSLDDLCCAVHDALVLPKPPPSEEGDEDHDKAEHRDPEQELTLFYGEGQPQHSLAFVWRLFRGLLVLGDGSLRRLGLAVTPFEKAVLKEWPRSRSTPIEALVDRLRPYYAWPDRLAVLYSDRYRSAFILAFLLAAFAVGMALLPIGARFEERLGEHSWPETVCIVLELVTILLILGLVLRGRHLRWHRRWIDYRLAAELIRHLRLVSPLGGARPFPQLPAHWSSYGQPATSWMGWYVRAVERKLGLPHAVVDADYLKSGLAALRGVMEEQLDFHRTSKSSAHHLDHRLHVAGIAFLTLTLICCATHLLPAISDAVHFPEWLPHCLIFFCGFLPALGAACAGISNQGEFRRIEKRSKAMGKQLRELNERIDDLLARVGEQNESTECLQLSPDAVALAGNAARKMVNETLDWRVVFLDQPLRPPA